MTAMLVAAPKRRPVLYWMAAAVYAAALFIQSALPSALDTASRPGVDKLLHAAAYGLMAVLVGNALAVWPMARRQAAVIAVVAAALTALYGLSDEIHQAFVPSRTADPVDWIADLIGAGLGAVLWTAVHKKNLRSEI